MKTQYAETGLRVLTRLFAEEGLFFNSTTLYHGQRNQTSVGASEILAITTARGSMTPRGYGRHGLRAGQRLTPREDQGARLRARTQVRSRATLVRGLISDALQRAALPRVARSRRRHSGRRCAAGEARLSLQSRHCCPRRSLGRSYTHDGFVRGDATGSTVAIVGSGRTRGSRIGRSNRVMPRLMAGRSRFSSDGHAPAN